MTIAVTSYGNNPQVPGAWDASYYPDQLIGGDLKIVTGTVTITGAALLKRGTVMGQVTIGAAATPAAAGGNTGNGTISAAAVGARAKVGTYTIRFTGPTAFIVLSPTGAELAPGAAAGAYGGNPADPEISFTFTAGSTPMVAGDTITIAVAGGSGSYKQSVATAVDGSQNPCAVLVDLTDATAGDVVGGVYLMAEVNGNALIYDPSLSLPVIAAAFRPLGLFVKTPVSAADPS